MWARDRTSLDILHQFYYDHNSHHLNHHEKLWLSWDFKQRIQHTYVFCKNFARYDLVTIVL